jgi:hypothetical protein
VTRKLESYLGIAKQFKMELRWFSREDFFDRIADMWSKAVPKTQSKMEQENGGLTKTPPGMGSPWRIGEYKQQQKSILNLQSHRWT